MMETVVVKSDIYDEDTSKESHSGVDNNNF